MLSIVSLSLCSLYVLFFSHKLYRSPIYTSLVLKGQPLIIQYNTIQYNTIQYNTTNHSLATYVVAMTDPDSVLSSIDGVCLFSCVV